MVSIFTVTDRHRSNLTLDSIQSYLSKLILLTIRTSGFFSVSPFTPKDHGKMWLSEFLWLRSRRGLNKYGGGLERNLRKYEERGATSAHRTREVKESVIFTFCVRSTRWGVELVSIYCSFVAWFPWYLNTFIYDLTLVLFKIIKIYKSI